MEGGRWGPVIILSAFMIQFLTFGTSFAMGVYTVEFLDYFENDAFAVSFILSINMGVFLGSGPIVSYMMTKYTHRCIVLVGGIMSAIGLLMMSILPYLPTLYIFYGILNGLGCCMSYTPSHVLSGLYYNKYQSLSTGIATSGSGLGSAVMPILVGYLIKEFSWKGSLYIVSGLNLNVLVFGALLRPVPISVRDLLLKEDDKKRDVNPINITQELVRNDNYANSKSVGLSCFPKLVKKHLFIFHNIGFVIYCLNNICWNFAGGIIMTFIPDYLVNQGISHFDSAFIVTMCGIGTFVGGLTGAVLGNVKVISRIWLFSLSNIVMGACCFIFVWISAYTSYILNAILYGFVFGITLGLLLVLVTDTLGAEHLGHGLGYLLLANGIGAFSGPPVAGFLEDITGSYECGLYTAGCVAVLGGVLLLVIPVYKMLVNKTSTTGVELKIHDIPDSSKT